MVKTIKELETLNDSELIKIAIDGDEIASHCIYTRYEGKIKDFLKKRGCKLDDIDDVTIITLQKALKSLDKYSEKGATFSTWLHTIAENTNIDWYRRQEDYTENIDDISYSINDDILNPEEIVIHKEKQEFFENILKNLTKEQQRLIELRTINGLSYEEISKELDITIQNVKTQLHRAKKQLIKLAQNGNEN